MGPFSYIPFMECNHAIISMQNTINGYININDNLINFNNNKGYIENNSFNITCKKNLYFLNIKSEYSKGISLQFKSKVIVRLIERLQQL